MTVLQTWLEALPIRMQSTLLLSLRGPDTHRAPEIKKVQRWMRGLTFKPGNPANVAEFMTDIGNVPVLQEKNDLARELEFCTQHFYSHLMHGLEVIGYRHPERGVAVRAQRMFIDMTSLMHLECETREDFELRLRQITWPDGQPDTFEEAIAQLPKVL